MTGEECVWSLEGRVDKARVSVIAPAYLSGPPTAAEPTACRMDEWSFLSAEVEGVNKQALRATSGAGRGADQWLKAAYTECTRDGSRPQRPSGSIMDT